MRRLARFFGAHGLSLKTRLGIGAGLLSLGALATALVLWSGLREVTARLDEALEAENRMARYAALSTQAATFIVIATESLQTELDAEARAARVEPVVQQIGNTFARLRADVESAVLAAEELGLDAQSRYGTQSLGLARMEAMLATTLRGLQAQTGDKARLRAHIDTFASSFDPLLSQAVNTEMLFRNAIISGIDVLRQRLTLTAFSIAGLTLLAAVIFQVGLIRPQLRRLDALRQAARQIGQEDFSVALPVSREDEIGQLSTETNRMAAALSARKDEVQAEWARLNETIADRTAALQAANAQLEEVDENRRRFFADVSHELRTPLTVILMEAQIGRQQDSPGREAFATIEGRAARLNRRIDDLLRVARSDSGQLALDPLPVACTELIAEVHEELRAEIANAGMELTLTTVPEVTLHCDRNWIRQVLVSLARNAIRHARAGGKIHVSCRVGEKAEISVLDNGPGVDPQDQSRIFERFRQGGTGNAQGFGVGLALCRWVVESHGGEITLTSPVDRAEALGEAAGTKVTVRMPLAD